MNDILDFLIYYITYEFLITIIHNLKKYCVNRKAILMS